VLKGKNLIDTIGKGWESFNLAFGQFAEIYNCALGNSRILGY